MPPYRWPGHRTGGTPLLPDQAPSVREQRSRSRFRSTTKSAQAFWRSGRHRVGGHHSDLPVEHGLCLDGHLSSYADQANFPPYGRRIQSCRGCLRRAGGFSHQLDTRPPVSCRNNSATSTSLALIMVSAPKLLASSRRSGSRSIAITREPRAEASNVTEKSHRPLSEHCDGLGPMKLQTFERTPSRSGTASNCRASLKAERIVQRDKGSSGDLHVRCVRTVRVSAVCRPRSRFAELRPASPALTAHRAAVIVMHHDPVSLFE